MMLLNENLYRQYWTGSDSPIAAEAFMQGQEAAIQEIAAWLADQDSSYEDAQSEYTWAERLTELLNKSNEHSNN